MNEMNRVYTNYGNDMNFELIEWLSELCSYVHISTQLQTNKLHDFFIGLLWKCYSLQFFTFRNVAQLRGKAWKIQDFNTIIQWNNIQWITMHKLF